MNDESFVQYKFRKIDKRLIESLFSQSLYFSKPDMLNDPFDCRIDLMCALRRVESSVTGGRKNLLRSFLSNPKFFETWHSTFDNSGVCCFSRENSNTLLWSHYADAHKGVCLKYEIPGSYLKSNKFQLTAGGYVEYLAEPIKDWIKNAPTDMTEFIIGLVHKFLKSKSPAWAYEKEARLIRPPGVFNFNEPVLNQICFGLRTPDEDIKLITDLARTYSGCSMFSKMFRDETEFGFTEKVL